MLGAYGQLSRGSRGAAALLLVGAVVALTACTGAKPLPPPHASAVPVPAVGLCHALSFDEAVAVSAPDTALPCQSSHTSETFAVGTLPTEVDGHLLAVDSARALQAAAKACTSTALPAFLGTSTAALRLSLLRAVWFVPSADEASEGARWYRCDVIGTARGALLAATKSWKGVLADAQHRSQFGMCGTAAPGAEGFERVACTAKHTWRAIGSVSVASADGAYPGEAVAKAAGRATCKRLGQSAGANPLNYQWGYEWPTQDEWSAGQTYGLCWAPA